MGKTQGGKLKQPAIGQYVLGKTIGEGTFGKVKLGTHILTGETVAVKILERERIKEVADVERVAREIHILKRVQHPHIIQLYEIIETPNQLFLIMEYCSGGELFDHIVECGRVPEGDACRFFQQILSGVEQIHRINVVHRDLKPENLLIDQDKNIKIVDFGLSNIYKDDQLLKTACGSPCYASPEMIAGHWYVPSRCDVWSCGVILFALVCGYLPFEDGNTAALYRKILNADYRTPKTISASAKELIGLMLTVDPEKRITVAEIRQHEWYRQVPESSAPWDGGNHEPEWQQDVLDKLDGFGFPRDVAVQSLKDKKHNIITTTYYLLLEKKRRLAEEGNPDQQSDAGQSAEDSDDAEAPEHVVTLEVGEGAELGIDGAIQSDALLIEAIKEGGAIAAWNAKHSQQQLQPGDLIVEVNGVRNDMEAMLVEFKKRSITMSVKPKAKPSSPPSSPHHMQRSAKKEGLQNDGAEQGDAENGNNGERKKRNRKQNKGGGKGGKTNGSKGGGKGGGKGGWKEKGGGYPGGGTAQAVA